MATFQVFGALLTGAFVPSSPIMFGDRLPLDFEFTGGTTGTIEWYLEFASDDPNAVGTIWHRETAEEDIGSGITHMPAVVRDFVLSATTLNRSVQLVRAHKFARVQIRQSSGSGITAKILSVFGTLPQTP